MESIKRTHIQFSQSALHSRNTFGTTIILHPHSPLFSWPFYFLSFHFIYLHSYYTRLHLRWTTASTATSSCSRPRRSIPLRLVLLVVLLLIPRRRPENRYYYTGCAPYVLCVTPINIERTALRPYPGRRPSFYI